MWELLLKQEQISRHRILRIFHSNYEERNREVHIQPLNLQPDEVRQCSE